MADQGTGEAAGGSGQTASQALLEPLRAYNFKVQVTGLGTCGFTYCSPLEVAVEPIRYREAGENQIVRFLPGQVSYSEVTLRYGLTNSADVWNWLLSAVEGRVQRVNVDIVALDIPGKIPQIYWTLESAWPSRWRGALLDTLSREVAIESLTLVYERIVRKPQA